MIRTTTALLSAALLVATAIAPPAASAAAGTGGSRSAATAVLARMSLDQRVGQLFMVGTPATRLTPAMVRAVAQNHVGNVILTGRSSRGVAFTAALTRRAQTLVTAATTAGVPLLVATDQEGGAVQVLSGPGFSTIPSALRQGTWSVASVRSYAKKWGLQLAAAGVDVDLGPVLDTVPGPAAARGNPPIGAFHREFGYTPANVSAKGVAFAGGLGLAGVAATVKHFPGLGRVTANTDTTAGVKDRVTTDRDPYLAPFAAAIRARAPFVMMSTATYTRIDPLRPAAFSQVVIGQLLRADLGFRGVVISDDLGNAKQVAAWTPAQRAVDFVGAGGDVVLTVNADLVPQMYAAVRSKALHDKDFRALVDAAALRVLTAKQAYDLLS